MIAEDYDAELARQGLPPGTPLDVFIRHHRANAALAATCDAIVHTAGDPDNQPNLDMAALALRSISERLVDATCHTPGSGPSGAVLECAQQIRAIARGLANRETDIQELIEASSLGEPAVKRIRETVPAAHARSLAERSVQLPGRRYVGGDR